MDEHLLIQKYFSDIGSAFLAERNVEIAVGDDASVISSNKNTQHINSLDTSIEGVHFLSSMSPEDIAFRSCVIALSDLAACGARPKWYSIAITLPQVEHSWLNSFSIGLQKFSDEYRIPLVGGDTTKGKLSITVQVMGEVDSNKAILRSTAKENQLIFVSGIIGNAYLGLKELSDNTGTDSYSKAYLEPKAQIDLGLKLSDIASACIDISDGLLQDLNLICQSSNVGAEIYLEKIPTAISEKSLELINSGDDYELCFTVEQDKYEKLMNVSKILNIPITLIGKTSPSQDLILYDVDNNRVELNSGYSHF